MAKSKGGGATTTTPSRKRTPSKTRSDKPRTSNSKKSTSGAMAISYEQIAQKAYEIWLRKGRPVGQDEQNWHEAELELKGRL